MTISEESKKGVVLSVLLQPRSSKNRVIGKRGDELKIGVTAPPVDGAANRALISFLSKQLGVAKNQIEIISGETSRHKKVKIKGVTPADINWAKK